MRRWLGSIVVVGVVAGTTASGWASEAGRFFMQLPAGGLHFGELRGTVSGGYTSAADFDTLGVRGEFGITPDLRAYADINRYEPKMGDSDISYQAGVGYRFYENDTFFDDKDIFAVALFGFAVPQSEFVDILLLEAQLIFGGVMSDYLWCPVCFEFSLGLANLSWEAKRGNWDDSKTVPTASVRGDFHYGNLFAGIGLYQREDFGATLSGGTSF